MRQAVTTCSRLEGIFVKIVGEAFVYFGVSGLVAGAVLSFSVRGRHWSWRAVVIGAVVLAALWIAYWIRWESRSCGPGCVRDATPAVAVLPVQLLAYGVAAAAVLKLSGRR
jgi:hypothetical protein